ncbi:MAG: 16S rRNA (cytidine(1402)-2'-O)-methyltransferase [Armatimonadota bacterium]|nr:MAG: 16S rRNA (cytidine(1402)-2'-O)-methyltransferase [Armatimonadota bacterium]
MNRAQTAGALYVVGTPIGNLEDVTLRALRVLREVDLIAAEDTRVTRKLLARHDIHTPVTSYHENSPPSKLRSLVKRLGEGASIAVVSDAGMPGISDPGADLIAACVAAEIPVVAIPGPTALMTALVLSGLPTDRVVYHGFLPNRRQARRKALEELRERTETMVFYEAPHRIKACLEDMHEILGDRRAAAARELTKVYEEVVRGRLSDLSERFATHRPRGEITLIIEGAAQGGSESAPPVEDAVTAVRQLVREGTSLRDATRIVAESTGQSRRTLYQAALDADVTRRIEND